MSENAGALNANKNTAAMAAISVRIMISPCFLLCARIFATLKCAGESFLDGVPHMDIFAKAFSAALAALVIAVFTPGTAFADIAGTASVIDGDTLEIHGQRIRLFGIDAPEGRQTCDRQGNAWRCGQRAALALADKIGRRPIDCKERDRDRYRRIVAVCYLQGEDLNGWLVRQGWALDYRQYSKGRYAAGEAEARAGRRGVWAGEFQKPWTWRKQKRK